ncbi:hypothetical protein EUX98_g2961 [Antrodiella citrinella]|uniref:Uncharacterized protein n=1 Tax=Antrodiella citrinella TaxID=2447956 RepID=A0A4S4MZX1_9APHY|nr:hypothetical protein EUX98_g2961 [Antrodiella citrinella]
MYSGKPCGHLPESGWYSGMILVLQALNHITSAISHNQAHYSTEVCTLLEMAKRPPPLAPEVLKRLAEIHENVQGIHRAQAVMQQEVLAARSANSEQNTVIQNMIQDVIVRMSGMSLSDGPHAPTPVLKKPESQFPGNRKWTWPGPQYDRKKVPYNHLGEGRGWEFERLTEEEWSYRKTSQAWSDVPLVVNTDGDALWRVRDSQAWRKVTLSGQSDESRPDCVTGEKRKHIVELHASEPALKKMKPKHDLDEVDQMSASPEATHLMPVRQPPHPIQHPDPDSHAQAGPSRVARKTLDWEMEDDTLFPPSPHVLPSARQHSPPGRQAVPPDVDTRHDARQKAVKLQTARTTLHHAQENYDLLYGQSMNLNAELTAWSVEYGGLPEGSEAQMAQQIIGADLLNELDLLNQELQKAKDAHQAAIKAVKLLENV